MKIFKTVRDVTVPGSDARMVMLAWRCHAAKIMGKRNGIMHFMLGIWRMRRE